MSPVDASAGVASQQPHASDAVPQLLSGWGRTARTRAFVKRARTIAEVEDALAGAGEGGVIARGAGRSYGDAAQNARGLVLDATALRGEIAIDHRSGLVRARAGATFSELLLALAADDLTLPVVPGTSRLTVGGAIASDVHGKNHVRDGSVGQQLDSLLLCTPARGLVRASAREEPELFNATLGGMGLTGVIVEATLRTMPLPSTRVQADVERAHHLETALARIEEDRTHRYAIAWVDLLSRGSRFGRSVVTLTRDPLADGAANGHLDTSARPRAGTSRERKVPFRERPLATVPRSFPAWMLRHQTVSAFNALHWHSARRHEGEATLTMSANLFPLDVLGEWSRMYGRGGLLQYQFVVPRGQEGTLLAVTAELRSRRMPMYLAVLKRFGAGSGGLLSFPIEGWTMAIDMPADAPGLHRALDRADEMIVAAGGRIYLAKDARTRAETLRAMYPLLERFLQVRAQVDPAGSLRSDLGRRLGLCE